MFAVNGEDSWEWDRSVWTRDKIFVFETKLEGLGAPKPKSNKIWLDETKPHDDGVDVLKRS